MRLTDYFRVAKNPETSAQGIIKATRTYLLFLKDLFRTFKDEELISLASKSSKNSKIAMRQGEQNLSDLFGALADYANMLKNESAYSFTRFGQTLSLKPSIRNSETFNWNPVINRDLVSFHLTREVVKRVALEKKISILEAEVFISLSNDYDLDLSKIFPS